MTSQQQRISIPDDWNGDEWACYSIMWPKSDMWSAILLGLITMPIYGRFWDETSGIVTETQITGYEIERRNVPLTDCDGQPVCTPGSTSGVMSILQSMTSEGLIMSLCGYNPKAFRVTDGVLEVRDFCGEWVAIGEVGLTATPPVDDEVVWPDGSEFSSCGKAWAITDLLQRVGAVIWDQRDNDPFTAWSNVDTAFPQIMSMGYTINAVVAALDIEVLQEATTGWYGPELFDASTWQSITCALDAELDDTATLPGKYELFNLVYSKIKAQWPLDPLAYSFWYNVMKAIGENDMRNGGLAGATDLERDCSCGTPSEPPYFGTLKFLSSFVSSVPEQYSVKVGNNGKYVDITWTAPEGNWIEDNSFVVDMAGGEGLTEVTLLVTPLSGSNVPTKNWVEAGDCPELDANNWVDAMPGSPTGRTETKSLVAGGYKMVVGWASPSDVVKCNFYPRKCGGSVSNPSIVYKVRLEIAGYLPV